jgi:glutathione S-transferase
MWTLHDFLESGNGYKVRMTLRELGRAFIYREVDILRGESREPWFLAKSSVGQIPLLELDDGTCLSGSTAILFHIAEGPRCSQQGGFHGRASCSGCASSRRT